MTMFYLLAAIVGVGLLALPVLTGGHDATDGADGLHADHAHPHGEAASLLLGIFSLRNLTFFLAAFGVAGLLLTWAKAGGTLTLLLAVALGTGALALAHSVFSWLGRNDAATAIPADSDFAGALARVTLPIAGEGAGQIASLIGGREVYLTARLADGTHAPLRIGQEVIVMSTRDGVALVAAAAALDLPPST